MSNWNNLNILKIKEVCVNFSDVAKYQVGVHGVTEIKSIDIKEGIFLVKHSDGDSTIVYDSKAVMFE